MSILCISIFQRISAAYPEAVSCYPRRCPAVFQSIRLFVRGTAFGQRFMANNTVTGRSRGYFMFENQSKLFTIGQFAKIHGVTKKTLMWYDEVDLVKPSVIGENGYRYYTYQQSSVLETVLMLRELNISIEEIKHFMSNRSATNRSRGS